METVITVETDLFSDKDHTGFATENTFYLNTVRLSIFFGIFTMGWGGRHDDCGIGEVLGYDRLSVNP